MPGARSDEDGFLIDELHDGVIMCQAAAIRIAGRVVDIEIKDLLVVRQIRTLDFLGLRIAGVT